MDRPTQLAGREAFTTQHQSSLRTLGHRPDRNAELINRVRQTYVYRLMRRLGLWEWLAPPSESSARALPARTRPSRGLKHIAVDLTPILPGGENGGAKIMTLELIRALAAGAPDCHFTLLTPDRCHDELAVLDAQNVTRFCVNQATDKPRRPALLDSLYRRLAAAPSATNLLGELNADLLFCPFTAPNFSYLDVPLVSVVYDLQYLYYPQFFDNTEILGRDHAFRQACLYSDRIVCCSDFVRQTILDNSELAPSQVDVIPIRLPERFGKRKEQRQNTLLSSLGLSAGRYLLYPANFWLHKNHELLLTAFGMYRTAHPDSGLKLVFTGVADTRRDFVQEACRRMGLDGATVFAGYLADEDLHQLMEDCAALIFPSLFEGFGMPLTEAMAAGKPLLLSNATSLPEVAGDAALYFDPRKPAEIASVIERFESEPDLRAQLGQLSKQRLLNFSGLDEMARRYLEVFHAAAGQPVSVSLPAIGGEQ